MLLLYVMGGVVAVALAVIGFLFYFLSKESKKESDVKIVPIPPQDIIKPTTSLGIVKAEEDYKKKVEDLEDELRSISEKGVSQAQEAMSMIDKLTKENEALKNQKAEFEAQSTGQVDVFTKQSEQLHKDNTALQSRLEASELKLQEMQEQAVLLRQQIESEQAQSGTAIEQFKSAQEQVRALDESKAESTILQVEMTELRMNNEELKKRNDQLEIEIGAMRYDEAKHRAQASGLEKICANYKLQLESKK